MVAVSGSDKLTALLDQKALFPHDPVHFLMVHGDAVPVELSGDFPISGFRKFLRDLFDPVLQRLIFGRNLPGPGLVIEAASREVHEFAPPRDGFDKISVVGNELPFFRDSKL